MPETASENRQSDTRFGRSGTVTATRTVGRNEKRENHRATADYRTERAAVSPIFSKIVTGDVAAAADGGRCVRFSEPVVVCAGVA